jgi:hypothetical protein
MQNVSFRNLDGFFDFIPEHELRVVQALRSIVLDCIPGCREKLSYNVPFYSRHSGICFIWPGSVTWGKVSTDTVKLGFTKGYLLSDESGYLDRGTRKQVYWRNFRDVKDIDAGLLKSYLYEAVEIDQLLYEEKRKTSRHKK